MEKRFLTPNARQSKVISSRELIEGYDSSVGQKTKEPYTTEEEHSLYDEDIKRLKRMKLNHHDLWSVT
jgi:hypothetical protein